MSDELAASPERQRCDPAPGQGSFDRGRLGLLLEAANLPGQGRTPQDLLGQLAPRVLGLTGCNFLSLSLYDERQDRLLTHYWKEDQEAEPLDAFAIDDCIAGWVWKSQEAMVLSDVQQESRFPFCVSLLCTHGVRSYSALPMTASGKRYGVFGIGKGTPGALGAEDSDFFSRTAHMVTLALENQERLRSEQRQNEQWRKLFEASAALAQSKLDLQELSPQIAAILRTLVAHDLALISVPDDDAQSVRIISLEPALPGVSSPGLRIPKDECLSSEIGSGEVKLFRRPDIEARARTYPVVGRAAEQGFQEVCALDLHSARGSVGVLYVASKREQAFQEPDLQLLRQAAAQVALVVEDALTDTALRREKEQLQKLLDINTTLASSLDLQELFSLISASVRQLVPHDHAAVAVVDDADRGLRVYALDQTGSEPGSLSPAIACPAGSTAERCFRDREAKIYNRADLEQQGLALLPPFSDRGVQSLCCIPLTTGKKTIGTLSLASLEDGAFAARDLELLAPVATQVATALDNARAYREISQLKDRLTGEKRYLETELKEATRAGEIVGNSPLLKRALDQSMIVANTGSTVLITGETGTGKELIARVIHGMSSRKERSFIKLNCAAIPTGLLESELFGHEKGAFTGAISQKIGRLELADKGTLLLDEVGDIPLELQPKLLRVLQDQEFERLGSTRTIHVDVRMIAATNRDLDRAVKENEFRRDLFYRLNVFPVHVPSLRERRDDIPLLVGHFVRKFSQRLRRHIDIIPDEAIDAMMKWPWPGNIRELENFIERSVILSEGNTLRPPLSELRWEATRRESGSGTTLREREREHIIETLRQTRGVLSGIAGAAARLGLKRTTLQYKIQKLGISRMEYLD